MIKKFECIYLFYKSTFWGCSIYYLFNCLSYVIIWRHKVALEWIKQAKISKFKEVKLDRSYLLWSICICSSSRLLLPKEVLPGLWSLPEESSGYKEGFWNPGQWRQRIYWGGRAQVSYFLKFILHLRNQSVEGHDLIKTRKYLLIKLAKYKFCPIFEWSFIIYLQKSCYIWILRFCDD